MAIKLRNNDERSRRIKSERERLIRQIVREQHDEYPSTDDSPENVWSWVMNNQPRLMGGFDDE